MGHAVPFASEELQAFAARTFGICGMRYVNAKEAGDRFEVHDALMSLWWAVVGLNKIAIAVCGGRSYDDSSGLHFSIASMNEQGRIARLIEEELKIDPWKEPGWKEA